MEQNRDTAGWASVYAVLKSCNVPRAQTGDLAERAEIFWLPLEIYAPIRSVTVIWRSEKHIVQQLRNEPRPAELGYGPHQ